MKAICFLNNLLFIQLCRLCGEYVLDMCKCKSWQSEESRAQSADFSKAYSKPREHDFEEHY